ncbi:unnamed protein product [Phytophthora lilii]|uniref:Unnamed protein product n=1 Tax=Phytophthora lilii TaxID=2077276 RepID=A0A9W6YJ63_9STRA|nr:unnamed protein product [Phytophthora lilii]
MPMRLDSVAETSSTVSSSVTFMNWSKPRSTPDTLRLPLSLRLRRLSIPSVRGSHPEPRIREQDLTWVSLILTDGAGTNKGAHSAANVNMRKLEEDTDNFKHDAVDRSLSQALMKARMAKKMNQKQLGTLINEKPQVIADYESGRAIPNGQIISKLNRALGVQLPRGPKKKKTPAN